VVEATTVVPFVEDAIARLAPMEQSLPRLSDLDAPLATVPTAVMAGDDQSWAPVVIRLFAVDDGVSVSVMPGGTGRVLAPGDDPRFPTACLAKDVWVLGRTIAPVIGPSLPQVDFGRSLPTRAADALYWTNRSAERAEAMARTARAVASRLEQDPGLALLDGGGWERRMNAVLRRVRRAVVVTDDNPAQPLRDELEATTGAIAAQIGTLLTDATTVREYLSVTTGRVLAHLAGLRTAVRRGAAGVDDLDSVLTDFAALAGMWHESIVRGPAWLIGDTGRRLERALVVLDLVEAAIGLAPAAPADEHTPEIEAASVEVLLAANDSLVAYRRRHRSDVELDAAIALVVHDDTNPRSLVSSIDLLESHAVEGAWDIGIDLARQARATLELPLHDLLPAARRVIDQIGVHVVERWFSSPVSPIVMRPTGDPPR
jgi:uncharacterized alpha-E superfamily protein